LAVKYLGTMGIINSMVNDGCYIVQSCIHTSSSIPPQKFEYPDLLPNTSINGATTVLRYKKKIYVEKIYFFEFYFDILNVQNEIFFFNFVNHTHCFFK
jgi:hypothetical protein